MTSTAVLVVTFVLLIAGVVGSLAPLVPGALLSLAGVWFHWWASGYSTPGTLLLVGFTALAVMAMLVDLFGGAIAADRSGASRLTVVAAVVVSAVLAVFTGPVGLIVGIPLTVFVTEYYRSGDTEAARRTAVITTVGVLASNVVQALFTGSILVGFALLVVL